MKYFRSVYLKCFFLALAIASLGMLTCCAATPDTALPDIVCFTCTGEDCQRFTATQAPELAGGVFNQGDIDLTGDGVPEHVRLEGDQVTIHQDDVEMWRSPEAWEVVDVALGDPNDDGRNEVFVVFWREDETGQRTNQPFIIGYRGGYYRELWGGSPVGFPITEVELADVDSDGIQEILVLEVGQDNSEERALAVWQWNQWWFSHVWRSEAGAYHHLHVGRDEEQQAMMCVFAEKE